MNRHFWISLFFVAAFVAGCKKKSDADPDPQGIPVIDIKVYDSAAWSAQNRLPAVADAEVDVMRIPIKYQYGTAGPLIEHYSYTTEDVQNSLRSVFKGRTNSEGKVTVMLDDTTDLKKFRWFVKASKGTRTIYSPEGFITVGIHESQESIDYWAKRPGKVTVVGDRKYYDWNNDGIILNPDNKAFGLPFYFQDSSWEVWLY
ncbi:hypothetical protein [Dyadobacter fermentans]|uniref:hypothetical protein n=1 Tax=Dyadobacter fermentans TaxID=94254 RepID=UPI001CBBA4B1|nr:hypothetical protein [Dyadobacter fermentans]MBZ1361427.1 hypothetical protein [Dyadobacter fermentans]